MKSNLKIATRATVHIVLTNTVIRGKTVPANFLKEIYNENKITRITKGISIAKSLYIKVFATSFTTGLPATEKTRLSLL